MSIQSGQGYIQNDQIQCLVLEHEAILACIGMTIWCLGAAPFQIREMALVFDNQDPHKTEYNTGLVNDNRQTNRLRGLIDDDVVQTMAI